MAEFRAANPDLDENVIKVDIPAGPPPAGAPIPAVQGVYAANVNNAFNFAAMNAQQVRLPQQQQVMMMAGLQPVQPLVMPPVAGVGFDMGAGVGVVGGGNVNVNRVGRRRGRRRRQQANVHVHNNNNNNNVQPLPQYNPRPPFNIHFQPFQAVAVPQQGRELQHVDIIQETNERMKRNAEFMHSERNKAARERANAVNHDRARFEMMRQALVHRTRQREEMARQTMERERQRLDEKKRMERSIAEAIKRHEVERQRGLGMRMNMNRGVPGFGANLQVYRQDAGRAPPH